jgi:hypothetical protein
MSPLNCQHCQLQFVSEEVSYAPMQLESGVVEFD